MNQKEFEKKFVNKIIHGDCLKVTKEWPDNCVDLVLTDPPYGIEYDYDQYQDTEENLQHVIDNIFPRLINIGVRVSSFCGVQNISKYPQANWVFSWNWRGTNTFGYYGINQWQPILCYGKDITGFGSINGMIKSDSIYYEGGNCDEKKCFEKHPCPKNIGIMTRLIRRLSNKDNLILDPFCGSGTTCVAAKMLGRRYIGIDISKEYCELSRMRLKGLKTGISVTQQKQGFKGLLG